MQERDDTMLPHHKYTDVFENFSEYSIKGISKKARKIVIQKGKDARPFYGIWYIYDVTPDLVKTVGWSTAHLKAEKKARDYIRGLKS